MKLIRFFLAVRFSRLDPKAALSNAAISSRNVASRSMVQKIGSTILAQPDPSAPAIFRDELDTCDLQGGTYGGNRFGGYP